MEALRERDQRTGRVQVLIADGPNRLQITVSDNGLGMPPNLAAHCFEPGVTSKPGARGLGLALVHRLVRGARGEITLRSTPDEGTTFDIILPKPPGRGANT